jgi:hypothetical protein
MTDRTADQVVAELPKNARETIRVALTEFNGHGLIDVRVWTLADGKPTKKGLTLRPEPWAMLLAELQRVLGIGKPTAAG